ncbi:MAG: site-specific DNA-methyltransferase [Paraclostridium sp.]|uniref:site-specific DNA-methyltransferase n=1 Tax=Paraclostridium sp. TaxID=2023273 RepID=UPI003EE7F00B
MEKLNGQSMDLTQNNLDNLKQLFPEVFSDGKIDFDKLRMVLGDSIEMDEERYEFKWNGKSNSIKISQTPSTGTLRPDKESSKNWDTTENLYIEGDNLEVLKLLQKSYFGKVKMIYIDPPYNTGKDFVYKDNFRDNIANYKEMTNQTTKANPETNGRYHTDWLNMMYPRLKLARNLLREDGVIFISIDENEQANLKKLCDEIFGEVNFIANVAVVNNLKGRSDDEYIATAHENLIIYRKSYKFKTYGIPMPQEYLSEYNLEDEVGKYRLLGLRKRGTNSKREDRPNMYYPFYYNQKSNTISLNKTSDEDIEILPKLSDNTDGRWRWGKDTALERINELAVKYISIRGEYDIYQKDYLERYGETRIVKSKSFLSGSEFSSDSGTISFKEIMPNKIFTNPKPIGLIKYCLNQGSRNNDIILDFFSGSSSTADAVMKLNSEDDGNRKFIMVQLPEVTDEKSEAYKEGYKNICEIGKERIRRAGEKVVFESGKTDLDIGFKVFKLDNSNIKEWSPSYDELAMTLEEMTDNLKSGRSKEDLLFEVLIKMGIELTTPVNEVNIDDKKIYNIGMGSLVICLEDEITENIIKEIPKYKSEFMDMKVVFKETGFKTDSQKMNTIQNLKQFGITDVRSV